MEIPCSFQKREIQTLYTCQNPVNVLHFGSLPSSLTLIASHLSTNNHFFFLWQEWHWSEQIYMHAYWQEKYTPFLCDAFGNQPRRMNSKHIIFLLNYNWIFRFDTFQCIHIMYVICIWMNRNWINAYGWMAQSGHFIGCVSCLLQFCYSEVLEIWNPISNYIYH